MRQTSSSHELQRDSSSSSSSGSDVRTFRTAKETIRTGEAGAMAAVGMPGAMRAGERRTERRQRPETYFFNFDAFSSYIQFPFNCVFWLVSCPSLLTTPSPLAALYHTPPPPLPLATGV